LILFSGTGSFRYSLVVAASPLCDSSWWWLLVLLVQSVVELVDFCRWEFFFLFSVHRTKILLVLLSAIIYVAVAQSVAGFVTVASGAQSAVGFGIESGGACSICFWFYYCVSSRCLLPVDLAVNN
jgi:hypothetical protein